MKIGRLSRRAISLLAGAMLLVSVLAGVLCMGALAEEGDYMANADSWALVPKADVDAAFGGNTCRDVGAWNEEEAYFSKLGRGTVVKVENVDFGTGCNNLELMLNVPEASAKRQVFVYVGEESYKASTHVPDARFIVEATDGFAWQKALYAGLNGLTGEQTVYIVSAGDQNVHISLKGLRVNNTEQAATTVLYVANPDTWTVTAGPATYSGAVNGCTIGGTNGQVTHTVEVADVDFTGAKSLSVYVGANGGPKDLTLLVDDQELATVTAAQSSYSKYLPTPAVDLTGKGLTGKHTVAITTQKTKSVNFNLMGLELEVEEVSDPSSDVSDPSSDVSDPDPVIPEGTYMADESSWRIVPASEHGYDDRGAAAWNAAQSCFTGVGRMTMLEVSDVDFGEGYNFMELLLSVPENCNQRFINVFVDDYKSGNPQARFYMTQTESGAFEWQGQFCEDFSNITGQHKVYIVGATDNKGYNFSVKGMRLSNVEVTPSDETLYVVNPQNWAVVGGVTGAYVTDPNACNIGKNNNALLKIEGIDFTDVTGISLMTGCNGEDKSAVMYLADPSKDTSAQEVAAFTLKQSTYSQFLWSDYENITGQNLTGVKTVWIASMGYNFNYAAIRTTKADIGSDKPVNPSTPSTPDDGSDPDGDNSIPDDSSDPDDGSAPDGDNSGEDDNPGTGVPSAAAIPAMMALTAAAAIVVVRRKKEAL